MTWHNLDFKPLMVTTQKYLDLGEGGLRYCQTRDFIETPSIEWLQSKAKEAPSRYCYYYYYIIDIMLLLFLLFLETFFFQKIPLTDYSDLSNKLIMKKT